jgi:hypothetical protein
MAINTQKFLPSAKGGALAKIAGKSSFVSVSKKTVDNIDLIKVKVIEMDKILKGSVVAKKAELDRKKREESESRKESIEKDLETKPKAEKQNMKMPKIPGVGILGWIKNFIGNILLGYFAVRLVDHLPKILPVIKFLGKAADFVIDIGGKLLNGLATFVDWGYKAYDATRGFVKNIFGKKGADQFDKLSGLLNTVLNLAVIAAMIGVGGGGGGPGGRGGQRPRPGTGGRPRVTTSGGRSAGRPDIRNPFRQRPTVTTGRGGVGSGARVTGAASELGEKGLKRAAGRFIRPVVKRIPIFGALVDFAISVALGEDPKRAAARATGAAIGAAAGSWLAGAVGIAAGSVVPVIGNVLAGAAGAAVGGVLGGMLGDWIGGLLYDKIVESISGKGQTKGYAGGGQVTRGGKAMSAVKRTVSSKGKIERKIPRQPGKIDIKPGADVGGEEKLFGLFPKPKLPDFLNPFKTIENTGKELGKSDYFGPILAITSKILLGQKLNQRDYENVGLGINLLVSRGIQDGQLKGGVAAAFAEGGFVDTETLNAVSGGGDISEWVAASFKDATESNAQKTLRQIQENLKLKKEGDGETGKSTTDESFPEGTGSLTGNTNAEKVFNFLKGSGFTEQAAAGVIGNLMQESGVNPKSKQLGGGPGRGIMQWGTGPGSGGRWDALVAWAGSSGKDPWVLDTQVEWMMKEMRSYGTYNRLKGVTDVKKSVVIFESEMEKAGVPNYPRRYQYAADALASFGGGKAGGMKDAGEGGVVGGGGNFVQGNSGSSYGVHFHIGPGNQTKGNILQPQYNADARASALKAFMQFVGQRSIYLGRSGVSVPKGKKISSAEASKLIAAEQRAHSARGSLGGIDMQVDFESKVGFPLKTFGLKYRPNGFGVSADIAGSNSFVAHGRYDEKGRVAPQEAMKIYHTGTPSAKEGIAKLLKKESVLDVDTSESLRKLDPALITQLNQQKTPAGILGVLRKYASYESGASQNIIIPYVESGEGDYEDSKSPSIPMIAMNADDDSFETLYRGG